MTTQDLEIYLHDQSGRARVIAARTDEILRDVLTRYEVLEKHDGNVLVFVGECEEAIAEADEVEGGIDRHEPVDLSLTLEVLELKRHRHIHVHRCRHVAVAVNFGNLTKHHKFSPATTVGTVTRWARKKFRLDTAAASEYVLRICDSSDQPRPDKHLGELAKPTACSICFDLVKEITPQG